MYKIFLIFFFVLASSCAPAGFGNGSWNIHFGVPGANGPVTAIATDGKRVIFGGFFSRAGGIDATNVVMWDGCMWSALGDGVGFYAGGFLDSGVNSIITAGGKIYVAGSFTNAGLVSVMNIARWDGTNWAALGDGLNNSVFDLSWNSGALYAGGHFGLAGSNPANRIAKWDGTNWSALAEGLSTATGLAFVHAIACSGNDVYVGGRFSRAGTVQAINIAKWDGTDWHTLGAGLGPDPVYALTLNGNAVYAGGGFTKSGNRFVRNIALWNGSDWIALGGGVTRSQLGFSYVSSLLFNGSHLFVGGGDIREIGGFVATNIARWDGATWSALGGGVSSGLNDSSVHALATTGAELFVAGHFTTAGINQSTNIALWHIPHSLSINRTGDQVQVSWPSTGTNFLLEAMGDLDDTDWVEVSQPPDVRNEECIVTESMTGTNRFYRLRRKPWL